jgi:hypothetical protein
MGEAGEAVSEPRVSDERLAELCKRPAWHAIAHDLRDARAELNEDETLRNRMAQLLTDTANAMKGEPEPLHCHDWSDLPKFAALMVVNERNLIEQCNAARARLAELERLGDAMADRLRMCDLGTDHSALAAWEQRGKP